MYGIFGVDKWRSLKCVCACVWHIRNGRPGVLLRGLCVPAERRDDEPVLHLRRLPQVTPLPLLSHSGGHRRRDDGFLWAMSLLSSQLSDLDRHNAVNRVQQFVSCQICIWNMRWRMLLSESVVCSLLPLSSVLAFHFSHLVAVDWAALLPRCVFSSITAR